MTRFHRWLILIAVAALAAALMGCGQQSSTHGTATGAGGASEIIEAMVPCGQVGPFSEVAQLFETANPGVKLEWIPENMVTIVAKIVDGKEKPDAFLSMGDLEVDQVEEAGLLLEGTRTRYAENSLSILVPKGNPAGVSTVADFMKPSVKAITLPDPALNSVGLHAREALENAGIWEEVAGKVLFARFAADSKTATAKREAEASIGYYPCSVEVHIKGQPPAKPKNIDLMGQVSADLYPQFWCEAGVVKGAKNTEGGRKLLAFLTTPEAQEIYRRWQFVQDASDAPAI